MKIKTEVFVGGLTDSQKDLLKSIVDFGSPYEMGDEVVELFEEVLYRSSNE